VSASTQERPAPGAAAKGPVRGLFIAFEGGEGAGKSTQAERLADVLRVRYGREVLVTREPGGTVTGAKLREMVLADSAHMTERAELLLYLADRALHVERVIVPALDRGAVVISDRHAGSSIAYQGAGRGMGEALVQELSMFATGSLRPHLTVLLDLDPLTGLGRARRRGDANRFEAEELDFHQRVRSSFLRQARVCGPGWAVIRMTADATVNGVSEAVERAVADRLGLHETGWVDVAARR
jgi:dTMP kinase